MYRDNSVSRIFAARLAFSGATHRWKRYVLLVALFIVFFYLVVTGVVSMYYAGVVIRPAQSPVTPIDRNLAYPYSSVFFKSREDKSRGDAVTLGGWLFNAGKTDSALIIAHGFGGNRFPFGGQTLDLIDAMAAINFNVLVFDMRNSGASEAGVSAFGLHEMNDVLGAVDYMRNAGYTHIAVLGVSTGANAAALAGGVAAPDEIGALILDSPIVDMRRFIMRLVRGMNPKLPEFPFAYEVPMMVGVYINGSVPDANLVTNLNKYMPRPVQLIHGNNDEIASLAEITAVYDSYMSGAVGRISIWNVPGAGHAECFPTARDEYIGRVSAFLQRAFI